MKTDKGRFSRHSFPRLLVLVPHRDVRLPMRVWSGSLFAAGLPGAWSFPWVAPLAALASPLPEAQLKSLAHALREHSRPSGGKFIAGPPTLAQLPFATGSKPAFAFGPSLDVAFPSAFFEIEGSAPLKQILPVVLGAALMYGPPPDGLPAPPQISFRASALAVMRFRPLPLGNECGDGQQDGLSFEWEIGKLHWLP